MMRVVLGFVGLSELQIGQVLGLGLVALLVLVGELVEVRCRGI